MVCSGLFSSVKIFRCQLPRNNAFYSAQPPKHDGSDKPLCPGAPVCHWCGTWKGDKICSSCKKARYCYEKHQALHWRTGHKNDCLQIISSVASNSVLPAVGIALRQIEQGFVWLPNGLLVLK
uniref:MYND-type domain-containing protein n=1 Tax=Zea mays TaxID=4577 RepID=B4FN95_MAIZE|nr:unknown [Zea mays]